MERGPGGAGQLLTDTFDRTGRADGTQQLGGPVRGQRSGRAACQQIPQQDMQLVDRTHPLLGQIRPPLVNKREHRAGVLHGHRGGIAIQRGDTRRRRGVDHVGLTPPTARPEPQTEAVTSP